MIVRKVLVIAVILLFIGMSVIPSTGTVVEKNFSMPTNYDGNTLYVGGDGHGNYTRIQDAIDNASDGDTVYVYNGTYYENIMVDKSVNLVGENKNTTIIDGSFKHMVITIMSSFVCINNFTLQKGKYNIIRAYSSEGIQVNQCNLLNSDSGGIYFDDISNSSIEYCCFFNIDGASIRIFIPSNNIWIGHCNIDSSNNLGIEVKGSNISIGYCRISNSTSKGIYVGQKSKNIRIFGNTIRSNKGGGIHITESGSSGESSNIIIENNQIEKNGQGNTFNAGILLSRCLHSVVIQNNNISNNDFDGILLLNSNEILIVQNIISHNVRYGVRFFYEQSSHNKIYRNSFIDNTQNAYAECNNSWYTDYLPGGNFWSDYTGNDYYRGINQDIPGSDGIGDTPYNISGPGNNTDRYPLMSPYGSPFQPLYLGYVDVHFEKEAILHRGGGYGGVLKTIYLNVNTSLDELPLTMVYHYTLEMNYSLRFPFWFAPLVAIGLKIKNYSDYSWESIKLLHHGQGIWYGNVTQDINLNLTGFEKGDELELTVGISVIRIPDLDTPGNNGSWEWFLRFIYSIPVLKDTLLHKWLLPILAPYNLMFESPVIFLRFQ